MSARQLVVLNLLIVLGVSCGPPGLTREMAKEALEGHFAGLGFEEESLALEYQLYVHEVPVRRDHIVGKINQLPPFRNVSREFDDFQAGGIVEAPIEVKRLRGEREGSYIVKFRTPLTPLGQTLVTGPGQTTIGFSGMEENEVVRLQVAEIRASDVTGVSIDNSVALVVYVYELAPTRFGELMLPDTSLSQRAEATAIFRLFEDGWRLDTSSLESRYSHFHALTR